MVWLKQTDWQIGVVDGLTKNHIILIKELVKNRKSGFEASQQFGVRN